MRSFDAKAWLWFLSSYAPLWVMLGLRFDPPWLRWPLIGLGVGCFSLVARLLARRKDDWPSAATVTITGDAGAEVSGYLAAYLLPFLTTATPGTLDLVAYAIFVWVAGLVYTRSNLMQVNPSVYLLGRRVLRATAGDQAHAQEAFVITDRPLRRGHKLNGELFADRVYVDHRKDCP